MEMKTVIKLSTDRLFLEPAQMQPGPAAFSGDCSCHTGMWQAQNGQASPFRFDQSGKKESRSVNAKPPDAPSARWLSFITSPRHSEHTLICQSERAPLLSLLQFDLDLMWSRWIKRYLSSGASDSHFQRAVFKLHRVRINEETGATPKIGFLWIALILYKHLLINTLPQ